MRQTARRAALAFTLCLAAGGAFAQTNLRIGLGDDPDALDPTTSRFYTTRIVFAALCDKLFDIDGKANVVPQLALGQETSPDGKTMTIKLRSGVKFHDDTPFDAAAASSYLKHERNIFLRLGFTLGQGRCTIWTCDLTDAYVRLNADYTT